ncbi:cytochrome b560 subunit of succinate dehydrogenase, partial [Clavulina sp. PMI_390]
IQVERVPASSQEILNAQRLRRPSSPHFTIYQPQMTWIPSIVHRGTGVGLSAGIYAFLIAYIAAPVTGIPVDSTHVIELVQSFPEWLKLSAKAIIALPFTFHSFNGLRHLGWDLVRGTSVKAVYRTGYTVIAASVVSTIALLMV